MIIRHTLYECSTYVKSLSYKCIVHPSIEYASPVWCLHATSDVNCLDAFQNRATHWACGSRWHRDTKQWSKSTNVYLTHLQWPSLHGQ